MVITKNLRKPTIRPKKMIRIRRKLFAGAAEAQPSGVTYKSAQVGNFVLDSIDKSTDLVEKVPVIKDSERFKKKVSRIKDIVHPLKKLLNKKREQKKELRDNKQK